MADGEEHGETPKNWQTGIIISTYQKGDRKECTNDREIFFLSLPEKMYAKYLEKKCRESKLEDGQCGCRPGRSTTNQIFTLRQIFEKFWEYAKDVFACFLGPEKAYDRVPRDKLWRVLHEYGIGWHLSIAIKPLCCQSEVCDRVNGKQSKLFYVSFGLRQGCVLSPFLCIIYINWMDKLSQTHECVTIGICNIKPSLYKP